MKAKNPPDSAAASVNITKRIESLGDWRGDALARMRRLIHEADPDVVEEWKWMGTPVWSHEGGLCTGESYKQIIKLTFHRGASLPDPKKLFNSSLEGNVRRAIDIREGEPVDAAAFKTLVRAAIEANLAFKAQRALKKAPPRKSASPKPTKAKPVLLAGGNPQIAKGYGDPPVQAYIDALPGWKREVAQQLDALIVRAVPGVQKAVKWNSPLYGVEGQGWFLGVHSLAKYLKVAFFKGTSLRPEPPVLSKSDDTRYFHLREGIPLDEALLVRWIQQASKLPGAAL